MECNIAAYYTEQWGMDLILQGSDSKKKKKKLFHKHAEYMRATMPQNNAIHYTVHSLPYLQTGSYPAAKVTKNMHVVSLMKQGVNIHLHTHTHTHAHTHTHSPAC